MRTTINITTKKGVTQLTTWEVWQNRPYPDIEKGGAWKWRSGGGLFSECGRDAVGIGRNYQAVLLRSDIDAVGVKGNRTDYAGFVPYRETVANPGAIVLFGKDLGETDIRIDSNGYASIRAHGGSYPDQTSPRERDFIRAAIVPYLMEFIEAHKAELYAQAVKEVKATIAERIKEAHAEIDKLAREAERAVANL